jgi:hypothetical protein
MNITETKTIKTTDHFRQKLYHRITKIDAKIRSFAQHCIRCISYFFEKNFTKKGLTRLSYSGGGGQRLFETNAVNKLRRVFYTWLQKTCQARYPHRHSQEFLTHLDKISDLNTIEDKTNFFRKLLRKQRKEIKVLLEKESLSEKEKSSLAFYKEWALWRFREVDLLPELENFLQNKGWSQALTGTPSLRAFTKHLEKTHLDLLWRVDIGNGIPGDDLNFDPSLSGNTPFKAYTLSLDSGKECNILRIPTITRDSRIEGTRTSQAEVSEEFTMYMAGLKELGQKHVYVNLMRRQSPRNQGKRSALIESLDRVHESPLTVLTLDKDSDFYLQENQYNTKEQETEKFKADYLAHLKESGDYYWPSTISVEKMHTLLTKSIESVQKKYFKSHDTLSRQERLNFIELHYCELIKSLFEHTQADSANITCRSCIDRGATQLVELWMKEQKENGTPLTQKELDRMTTLTFAPALMASSRLPHEHRVKRQIQMLKAL